jgi:hypothetical protein
MENNMRFFISIFFVGVVLNLSALNLFSAQPGFNIDNKSNEDLYIVVHNAKFKEPAIKPLKANKDYDASIDLEQPTKIFLYKQKKSGASPWDNLSGTLKNLFGPEKDKYKNYEPVCVITFASKVHASTLVGQSVTYPRTIYIKYKSTGDQRVTPQEGYGIAGSLRWTKKGYNLGNNVRPDEMDVKCVTSQQK